jgi:succinate dehydrogenase/fumarate reductase flavoprotein subunit
MQVGRNRGVDIVVGGNIPLLHVASFITAKQPVTHPFFKAKIEVTNMDADSGKEKKQTLTIYIRQESTEKAAAELKEIMQEHWPYGSIKSVKETKIHELFKQDVEVIEMEG